MQNDSLAGYTLEIKSSLSFFFLRWIARSVGLLPKRTILVAHRGMLGLRAWGDGLNGILFEFLDDDTKLAQSCRNWLYVQHWYAVAPDHVESCKKKNISHVSIVVCVLPGVPDTCPFSCVSCPGFPDCEKCFLEGRREGDGLKWCPHKVISAHMLGHVHGGQPTVI